MRLYLFTTLLLTLPLQGCYVLKLAYEQAALLTSRTEITDVIADKDTDTMIKKKLNEVNDIIAFAKTAGLNTEDAYTDYIKVDRDSISFVVFAAHADKLKLVQWWYPIVGELPYRGYFDIESRDTKAKELANEGYDISKSNVDAYSSLGWFKDPIYSTMLTRKTYSLAQLLFHELTHRTYWLEDHSSFNENIAEFTSYLLTSDYLIARGKNEELEKFKLRLADQQIFQTWITQLREKLKEVYDRGGKTVLQEKEKTFTYFLNNRPKFQAVNFIGNRPWNNARVMVAKMYTFDVKTFLPVYTCLHQRENFKNIGDFLKFLEKSELSDNPEQKFLELCVKQEE